VEQSFGCSTETGDDNVHFQATTQGLSVPHLMCRQMEGTSTTAQDCCSVFFRDSGAGYKTADLLTYFCTDLTDKVVFNFHYLVSVCLFVGLPVRLSLGGFYENFTRATNSLAKFGSHPHLDADLNFFEGYFNIAR